MKAARVWNSKPRVLAVFFVTAALQDDFVYALGWLAFLVAGILVVGGGAGRSRMLAYLAAGCLALGVVLLVTKLVLNFSG